MKNFFSVLAVLFASVFSSLAADNKIIDKQVDEKDFTRIEVKGSTKVYYTQGDKFEVRIHGKAEFVEQVEIWKDGETLYISQKGTQINGWSDFVKAIKRGSNEIFLAVYVTSPDLIGVTLSGSGDFTAKETVDTDNLNLVLRGSGDIDFKNILCDNLDASLSGSGDIEIRKVECITSRLNLRGSGDLKVKQFKVRKTDINLVGSGDIDVECVACDEINARLTGSGDITISGQKNKVNQEKRGSGDINIR